jgi:hypothetical protein
MMSFPTVRTIVVPSRAPQQALMTSAGVSVSVRCPFTLTTTARSFPCFHHRSIRKSHISATFPQRRLTNAANCVTIHLRSRAPGKPLVLSVTVIGASRWRFFALHPYYSTLYSVAQWVYVSKLFIFLDTSRVKRWLKRFFLLLKRDFNRPALSLPRWRSACQDERRV